MPSPRPHLLRVYARNVELWACKRNWSFARLARELGVNANALMRIRSSRNRYIDPELFGALMDVFGCEPNDLLMQQPGIDYTQT